MSGKFDDMSDDIPQPKQPYPFVWLSDATLELNSRYLIKGLIDQASFTLIYGPSGSGKSFFTADIAQHIALGSAWRGRKVNKSLVVYVASEAGASILRRFVGWRENRLSEVVATIPLAILTRGPNLIINTQVEALKDQLAYLQDEAKLPLGLTIFDTLSRSMPGGDENSAEDMTEVISAADYLRDTFKSATAFVHHTGKNIDQGARGHSSLFAAADCVLRIDEHIATLDKIRDGISGEQYPFSLEPITLGEDIDGELITTCLLNEAETGAQPKRELKGLGKNQRPILDALKALVADTGKKTNGSSAIPQGVLVASFDELCKRMEPKFPALKAGIVRKRVNEAINGLEGSGYAGIHGDYVWLK